MKRIKKFLSILLTLVMVIGLVPASSLPAMAATTPNYPNPTYIHLGAPEVAIFNAYTGNNEKFFTNYMNSGKYNAVEKFKAGSDKTLKYDTTVSSTASYEWTDFPTSNLAAIINAAHQLKAGYAVTRTSNSHSHYFWRGVTYYKSDMTSFINADFKSAYSYGIRSYSGYSSSGTKIRYGNAIFGYLPKENQRLTLEFGTSVLFYNNYEERCTCGGSATGHTISFYDGTAPELTSAEITDEKGNKKTSFGAGETVYVTLKAAEPLRFADHSASGKGNVYIGLVVEGATPDACIYPHLTSLNNDTLTFSYVIPENASGSTTVTGIDLSSAPDGCTALMHKSADVPLKQLCGSGAFNASLPDDKTDKTGITLTTCYVTDMAGNALVNPNVIIPRTCYIDCEGPFVAKASIEASTLNYFLKESLGTQNVLDASDRFLGVGDYFSASLYLNEVVEQGVEGSIAVTTNVKRGNGEFVTLSAKLEGTASAKSVGSEYGLGASRGMVSFLRSASERVTADMTVVGNDGKICITSVDLSGLTDLSGNPYDTSKNITTAEDYRLDVNAPLASIGEVVQTASNAPFYFPVTITDGADGSGAEGLTATVVLSTGGDVTPYYFAVTDTAEAPAEGSSEWKLSRTGVGHSDFIVKGTAAVPKTQYFHVKSAPGEQYNFSSNSNDLHKLNVKIYTNDYAGNRELRLLGMASGTYSMDTSIPYAYSLVRKNDFDSTTNTGSFTVEIEASDSGSGLASVEYKWLATGTDLESLASDSTPWQSAVGSLDGNPSHATLEASSGTVSLGETFSKRLFVKVADAAGNESKRDFGVYNYSLSGINYKLNYSTKIMEEPSAMITALDENGSLVFDAVVDGEHYVKLVTVKEWRARRGAGGAQIFIGGTGDDWYHASRSEANGEKRFTIIEKKPSFYTYSNGHAIIGNLNVNVYAGPCETILKNSAATSSTTDSSFSANDTLTVTSGAKEDSFTLRISSQAATSYDSQYANLRKVFSLAQTPLASDNLKRSFSYQNSEGYTITSHLPWRESYGLSFASSETKNETITIDIGEDVNGWNYEDVDWEKSELVLRSGEGVDYVVGTLSPGAPRQTVTLPSVSEIKAKGTGAPLHSGSYTIWLYLYTHACGDFHSIEGDSICLDLTEPGSLSLDVLSQNDGNGDTELSYDPASTIYYPVSKGEVSLSVEALNAAGKSWNYDIEEDGYGIHAGAADVVAWNVNKPNERVSLGYDYLGRDENGNLTDQKNIASGKRRLYFGDTTGVVDPNRTPANYKTTIAVQPNKDNKIALQILYANGKASEITYITVHPVSLSISGSLKATPEPKGAQEVVVAAPGTASVVFTPTAGSLVGDDVTLYCRESYKAADGSILPVDPDEKFTQMTRLANGSFTMPIEDSGLSSPVKDGKPRGRYFVYAEDSFANRVDFGLTDTAVLIDSEAPVIKEATIWTGKFGTEGPDGESIEYDSGQYNASFVIEDLSFFDDADHPAELTVTLGGDYAEKIGAKGESLTLTLSPDVVEYPDSFDEIDKERAREGHKYVWKLKEPNKTGIYAATAYLEREGEFHGDGIASYAGKMTKAKLTVYVNGVVSPCVKEEDNLHITMNLSVKDRFGRVSAQAAATTENLAIGVEPVVMGTFYNPADSGSSDNYQLGILFNVPVQPVESWINRDISGYAEEWFDSFPIWKDGLWQIEFSDVFGTRYVKELLIEDNDSGPFYGFGPFGIELSFSTLDPVDAATGVVITASASKSTDLFGHEITDEITPSRLEVHENGDYELKRRWVTAYTDLYNQTTYTDRYDTLVIHINNIVSGAPKPTLYFYFDEFKQQYAEGSQPRGDTAGFVTVSYTTDRETKPIGDVSKTFRYGDNGAFSFQYYDEATGKTYTVSKSLSDFGITLKRPEETPMDTEAPVIDIVTVWKQQNDIDVQAEAFPGSADVDTVAEAFARAGGAQTYYKLVVNASDASDWKLLVKNAAPNAVSFASAGDAIPGVTVSGNTVTVTNEVKNDFYIVAVDNAAQSGASADNFSFIKIPCARFGFDNVKPEIKVAQVAESFYKKALYIRATDKNNKGEATKVSVSGDGIELNPGDNAAYSAAEYPWKVVLTTNGSYTLTATDEAGNVTRQDVGVSGIDTDPPKLTVVWTPFAGADSKNPPTGPVNTDIVARITSNKDIEDILMEGQSIGFDEKGVAELTDQNDPTNIIRLSRSNQALTVRFTQSSFDDNAITLSLTFTAPNGRSAATVLALNENAIDKLAPVVADAVTPEYRVKAGGGSFGVPYREKHVLSFSETVNCLFPEKKELNGELAKFGGSKTLEVLVEDDSVQTFRFVDMAGNLKDYEVKLQRPVDNTPPVISLVVPEDATNNNAEVTVKANEQCTLEWTTGTVTANGTTYASRTVEMTGSGENWSGTVTVPSNGTFRVTAFDMAGNSTDAVFAINSIDRVAPTVTFNSSTIIVRQDSPEAELKALLDAGIAAWDNVKDSESYKITDHIAYNIAAVDLSVPGVYTVTYTATDEAGNEGTAERYVKVVDKNLPYVKLDGEVTEENGTTTIAPGEHSLTVTGLKTPNEPYTVQLTNGIRSVGQMKRVSDAFPVGKDGKFTLTAPGFYTVLITTQSRQTYRFLVYVEN